MSGAHDAEADEAPVPLCLHCVRPVSPSDYYCPHCGQSVGQLTPYLPYESIWFQAGMWARLWDRMWYKERDSFGRKCFFFALVVWFAPVLLLALPTVWRRKFKRREE